MNFFREDFEDDVLAREDRVDRDEVLELPYVEEYEEVDPEVLEVEEEPELVVVVVVVVPVPDNDDLDWDVEVVPELLLYVPPEM